MRLQLCWSEAQYVFGCTLYQPSADDILALPPLLPLLLCCYCRFTAISMYFIWWRRWKRFLEICYLWWNKFVLLVCLCSHSKWWLGLWCAVLFPFSVYFWVAAALPLPMLLLLLLLPFCCTLLAFLPTLLLFHAPASFILDSVFGSQNINKTFSTVAQLNGSAFIFVFVYRF